MGDSRFKEEFGEKAPDEQVNPARPVDEADLPPGRRLVVIPPLPPAPPRPSAVHTHPPAPDPEPETELVVAVTQPPPRPQSPKPHDMMDAVAPVRFCLLSSGLLMGIFVSTMALFSVTTSMHKIANEFKALVSVTWVVLAYILAECCCGLVFSGVSDIVGRRSAFVWAILIFCLASLAAGFSANLLQLVFARAIQGIGGSGLFVVGIAALQETCPDGWHSHAARTVIAVFGLGCFMGPLLGGLLNQYVSWRWMFWMNGPLCLISVVIVLVAWPPPSQRLRFRRSSWRLFDYFGSVLLIFTVFLFIFAFQNVGLSVSADAWASTLFIAPFTVSICLFILLFLYEHRVSRGLNEARPGVDPVFPLSMLRDRLLACSAATALLLGFPILTLLFTVPLRCELVSGKTPAVAALMMLPLVAAAGLGCTAAALANLKRNTLYTTTLAGPALVLTGCGLLCTVSGAGDDANLMGFLVLVGFGAGMSMASAGLTMGLSVTPIGYVSALAMLGHLRSFGGCLGVAVFSILLHNQILTLFPFPVTPEMLAMLSDSKSAIPIKLETFMALGVDGAFHAAAKASTAMAGMALLAALFALPLPRVDEAALARRRQERRERHARREADEAAMAIVRLVQREADEMEEEESRRARIARRQIRYVDEERRLSSLSEEERLAREMRIRERRERAQRRAAMMRGGREDRSWVLDPVYPVELRLASW